MGVPAAVVELVKRFENNKELYKRPDYKETRVRVEFVDPLFEALGWDVRNVQGYAEQYKDVVHEDAIKVRGTTRAPDYCFRIGGTRKFFLEVKKPSVAIAHDVGPAYQLRRYAWSAKLPLSILTDFEELAVYDSRRRPRARDKVSVGRILYLTFDQYLDRWDDIQGVFAKDSILQGSFDRYVQKTKRQRGTSEVDSEFLKEIEIWRETLARNLALRNPALTVYELNFAVQRTIDRIIFLRMCEDRGIEKYGRLRTLAKTTGLYQQMGELYRQAHEKYNSGLFDFQADTLTPALVIDDKTLAPILGGLYYPQCPYEFSVLPADVLGQVYEQFLGKVIRLTAGHRAKVEEKPEVKKAGGVYYTPTYIVDYIVKQTVGKLIADKSPRQIAKMRFLDPACGSGSFLLGAYQRLLDHHLHWYQTNNPEKQAKGKNPALYQGPHGGWRLTSAEKKRILTNNIYGVDIDPQAVEVTKLSLLLKVLEKETDETLGRQMTFWREPALPDLGANIKCGNALIGPDYFSGRLLPDEDELRKINPFDWQAEFPAVMANGGFDAVVGNPPYVRQEALGAIKTYFQKTYRTYHGIADLYVYFVEKGVSLLRENGLFGYIVANKWMRANYGKPLRRWLKDQHIVEILDFGDLPVFTSATTYPCILTIKQAEPQKQFSAVTVKTLDFSNLEVVAATSGFTVDQARQADGGWSLVDQKTQALLDKLKAIGVSLGDYVDGKIYRGVLTGLNAAFVIDAKTRTQLIAADPGCESIIKPFLAGRDIKRYQVPKSDKFLIFTRRGIDIDQYPSIKGYLAQFKDRLAPKPKGWQGGKWPGRKAGSYQWYEIQDTVAYFKEFEKTKIITPSIIKKPSYYMDDEGFYSNDKTSIIASKDYYLCGLLNSKILDFYMRSISSTKRGGYFEYKPMYISQLPIKAIDNKNDNEVALRKQIGEFVAQITRLYWKLVTNKVDTDKKLYQRQIDATDKQIDQVVYQLYGLTDQEIQIVEANCP